MRFMILLVGLALFIGWGISRTVAAINFDTHIGDYIQQAATSPTPEIAAAKLDQAIAEIEREGLTQGNTSILFTYPTNDVDFWHQRLVDSRNILKSIPANDSPLEISNTMMRVHESIMDSNKDGQSVAAPDGISIFPNNTGYCAWCIIALLILTAGVIAVIVDL